MRVLIAGGAGFVGSSLAFYLKRKYPQSEIVVLDNLIRKGPELNLPLFRQNDIQFIKGDIRNPRDLEDIPGHFDLMLDASAEASVHAGTKGDLDHLFQTNITGTINCLNFAKERVKKFIFLSTSRVFSIDDLLKLDIEERDDSFMIRNSIEEDFPKGSFRSLYGTSKLCSELLCQEYARNFGMNIIVNRMSVIAGPGQWGHVDQGVFTYWVAKHVFGGKLNYIGFKGEGKQVRDLLHPEDLCELIEKQFLDKREFRAEIYNVGGGHKNAVSLKQYTSLCQNQTQNIIEIGKVKETNSYDIPIFVTNNSRVEQTFSWSPKKSLENIVEDIYNWLIENKEDLKGIFY